MIKKFDDFKVNEDSSGDFKYKIPREIWGKDLPPAPDEKKWEEILAELAFSYDNDTKNVNDLILTIGGLANGTTRSGSYQYSKDKLTKIKEGYDTSQLQEDFDAEKEAMKLHRDFFKNHAKNLFDDEPEDLFDQAEYWINEMETVYMDTLTVDPDGIEPYEDDEWDEIVDELKMILTQ